MENYGFVPLTVDEANVIGLPSGTGLFSELFNSMSNDVREGKLRKSDIGTSLRMSPEEKRVSFYNRYFVFKKVRDVDAESVSMKSGVMESVAPELSVVEQEQPSEQPPQQTDGVEWKE